MQVSSLLLILHMEDACWLNIHHHFPPPPFPSYQIMLRCWNQDAKKRPRMAAIHKQLESSILTNHYAPS